MTQDASQIYEIRTQQILAQRTLWQVLFRRRPDPGAVVVTIHERATGRELFRHLEDDGPDDEDHLLAHIERDLATLSASVFATRWI